MALSFVFMEHKKLGYRKLLLVSFSSLREMLTRKLVIPCLAVFRINTVLGTLDLAMSLLG